MLYVLTSGRVHSPTMFIKIVLVILGLLLFHMDFGISIYTFYKVEKQIINFFFFGCYYPQVTFRGISSWKYLFNIFSNFWIFIEIHYAVDTILTSNLLLILAVLNFGAQTEFEKVNFV